MEKIKISDRVDLFVDDCGFIFTSSLKKPENKDLNKWSFWDSSWQSYKSDDVVSKIYTFLENLPDRYKSKKWYQKLRFN